MPRERNPRRVILDKLREVNQWMRWAVSEADEGRRVYDAGTMSMRPRLTSEWLENDPARLREIAEGARIVAMAMTSLAEYADAAADAAADAVEDSESPEEK